MNHELAFHLRAAKRLFNKPARPNKSQQQTDRQAKNLLRHGIYEVLAADDDQWLEMVRNYNAASDPIIRRLTVDVLIQRHLSKNQTIVSRATIWLAIIGGPAVAALNIKLMKSHSQKLGVAVVNALGDITPMLPEHARALQCLKLDAAAHLTRHPEVRYACVEALFKIRRFSMRSM